MKKLSVPVLLVSFALAATPVYAAPNWFNFDFSGFFGFLGVHNVPSYIRVSPSITPQPTFLPQPFFTNPPSGTTDNTGNENSPQGGNPPGLLNNTDNQVPPFVHPGTDNTANTSNPGAGGGVNPGNRPEFLGPPQGGPDENPQGNNDNENRGGGGKPFMTPKPTRNPNDDRGRPGFLGPGVRDATPSLKPNDKAGKLQALVTRMLDSFQNRLDNYTAFLDKVKSRRDKLLGDGKDVTKLNVFLTTATNNLTAVQNTFASVKSALAGLDYTQSTGTVIKAIRDQLTTLRQAFTNLHKSMSDAVHEIIQASGSTQPEPTQRFQPKPFQRDNGNGNGNANGLNNNSGGNGGGRGNGRN